MGELGSARHADHAQDVTRRHLVARLHHNAAPAQMAVLGFPAAAMIDDNRIAGISFLDQIKPDVAHVDVGHVVAKP